MKTGLLEQDGKVLLARLNANAQLLKDNEGKKTSEVGEFIRTKTYVKPKDMLRPSYPVFPQPYQLAVDLMGRTWNDYNKVSMVSVASCDFDCWYCFIPKELRSKIIEKDGQEFGRYFSADEVIAMFKQSGSRVWRLSGGEPLEAPEFVIDFLSKAWHEDALLWVDTNMSPKSLDFFNVLKAKPASQHVHEPWAVLCGCFKGFTREDCHDITGHTADTLDFQFEFARAMVDETTMELFWYVPGIVGVNTTPKHIEQFFERMVEEVDPLAPLRTYILQIKDYSSTMVEQKKNKYFDWLSKSKRPIDVWQELLEKYYEPEQLWLPNHQIMLRNRERG